MSARDDLDYFMETAFGIEPSETSAFFDAYRDEVLREAAQKQRDHAGDNWRNHMSGDWFDGINWVADLIDPAKP